MRLRAESLTGLSLFQVPKMIRNAKAVSASAPKPRLSIAVRPLSPPPPGATVAGAVCDGWTAGPGFARGGTAGVVVSTLQAKFNSTSNVDPDTEMSNLIQLLNVYAANARVMSAIQEMMDALIRAQ